MIKLLLILIKWVEKNMPVHKPLRIPVRNLKPWELTQKGKNYD